MSGKTLFEKVWDSHVVPSPLQDAARRKALREAGADPDADLAGRQELLYIDLHLIP